MPQLRWGGNGALSTAERVTVDFARFDVFEDDARFFLAAMRTLSGLTGGYAPTLSSACMTAGTFYGGLFIAPRLRPTATNSVSLA